MRGRSVGRVSCSVNDWAAAVRVESLPVRSHDRIAAWIGGLAAGSTPRKMEEYEAEAAKKQAGCLYAGREQNDPDMRRCRAGGGHFG